MTELAGKNALVTGGSRGIGPYIARALAARGMNLALSARSEDALVTVASAIADRYGVKTVAISADVTEGGARTRLVERANSEIGAIDVLVNNAGVEWIAYFATLDPEVILNIVRTNFEAPLMLTRLLLPAMIDRGIGHVVNVSSLGGKKGSPYMATYAGTKAALNEWSSSLREELRDTGVSVSVVCPGFISEAGIFAEYGYRAPLIAGESPPQAVADAVLRALGEDLPEVLINPGPIRAMTVANAISPRLMTWLFRRAGLHRFFREQAERNEQRRRDSGRG